MLQPIVRLHAAHASQVVDVFCAAFADYPVMRFVLGEHPDPSPGRLRTLIGFFVAARALRDEPLLAIGHGSGFGAAATVSFPDDRESPAQLTEIREQTWRLLGDDARARYDACGAVWGRLGVEEPHTHLNMIGVRPALQGMGLARRLLDHVQEISRATPGSNGVSLTTEDARNVPIYRRCGYQVVGEAEIAPSLRTWSMFREL